MHIQYINIYIYILHIFLYLCLIILGVVWLCNHYEIIQIMLMLTFCSCISHLQWENYLTNLSLLCEYLYPMNRSSQHIYYLSNSQIGQAVTRITYRLQLIILHSYSDRRFSLLVKSTCICPLRHNLYTCYNIAIEKYKLKCNKVSLQKEFRCNKFYIIPGSFSWKCMPNVYLSKSMNLNI